MRIEYECRCTLMDWNSCVGCVKNRRQTGLLNLGANFMQVGLYACVVEFASKWEENTEEFIYDKWEEFRDEYNLRPVYSHST